MKYNGAIIIQGPSSYVKEIKKAWNGYNLIWSTWVGSENYYNNDDIVIYNDKPVIYGTGNIVLQQLTTLNGISKAKEFKYDRVLKWRSDMIPTNADNLINLFDMNSINFFMYCLVAGGYYVDYFMEGNINDIYNIWNFNEINPQFAERALSNNIDNLKIKNIKFIGNNITEENNILWLKKDIKLSIYKELKKDFIYEK